MNTQPEIQNVETRDKRRNTAATTNINSILDTLRALLPIVATIGGLAVVAYSGFAVFDLAISFQTPGLIAVLSAATTVGAAVVLGLFIGLYDETTHAARGIATIFFLLWLVIVVALVLTQGAVRYGIAVVPNDVVAAGAFIFAALAGLSLLPVLFVLVIARRVPGDKYSSTWHATGDLLGVMMKGAAFAASIAGAFYFGVANGMPPMYAAFASVVIELGALYSLAAVSKAKARRDAFDVAMWQIVAGLFITYLVLVSGEAVQSFAGWQFMPAWVHTMGKVLYSYALGVTLIVIGLTTLLTRAIDRTPAADDTVTIKRPDPLASRIAGGIRGARAGWTEIEDAWNNHPALPRPTTTAAARDVDALSDDELRDLVRRVMQERGEVNAAGDAGADGAARVTKRGE